MKDTKRKTESLFASTTVLAGFSAFFAFCSFPHPFWRLGAGFAVVAFASIFLRVGWFVPLSMAGAYLGLWSRPQLFTRGNYVAEMEATLASIFIGAFVGLVVGFMIDASRKEAAIGQSAESSDGSDGPSAAA